jgi:hypothetical protein
MKTYLRNTQVTREDVQDALDAWLKSQAGKKHAHKIERQFGSQAQLVDTILCEIQERRLKFTPIHYRNRIEPNNGKVRRIGIEGIKQQICGYLVVRMLRPMFDAKIGYFQGASIEGKGQAWTLARIERMKADSKYCIEADIVKAYPSTTADVVMRLYKKYCACEDVLYVVQCQLDSYDNQLSIGSYFSLFSEHLVLSEIYHYVESLHKTRRGERVKLYKHQIWFMDNLWLFGDCKRDLKLALKAIEAFSRKELGLSFHAWSVTLHTETTDAIGWRAKCGKTVIRRVLFKKIRRAYRRMSRAPCLTRAYRCISFWGFVKKSGCKHLRRQWHITFDKSRAYISQSVRRCYES